MSAHYAKNVLLSNTILQQSEHAVLNDVIEAWVEATARYDGSCIVRRVEVDFFPCTGTQAPLVDTQAIHVLLVCKPS